MSEGERKSDSSAAGAAPNLCEPAEPTASAAKRGRNPRFPYVPIIVRKLSAPPFNLGRRITEQLRGEAYATRAEAVARAQYVIEWRKTRALSKSGA